jgi:hypothetical protein
VDDGANSKMCITERCNKKTAMLSDEVGKIKFKCPMSLNKGSIFKSSVIKFSTFIMSVELRQREE